MTAGVSVKKEAVCLGSPGGYNVYKVRVVDEGLFVQNNGNCAKFVVKFKFLGAGKTSVEPAN